jgi:hypothetical protein
MKGGYLSDFYKYDNGVEKSATMADYRGLRTAKCGYWCSRQ